MTFGIYVIAWILCSGFAALLADRKGHPAGWFAVAGLLVGPIGLLWAAFTEPVMQSTEVASHQKLGRHW